MPKIRNMENVRGGDTGFPVELWVDDDDGRLVVRGINEGGFGCVDIDLLDLLRWVFTVAPEVGNHDAAERAFTSGKHLR